MNCIESYITKSIGSVITDQDSGKCKYFQIIVNLQEIMHSCIPPQPNPILIGNLDLHDSNISVIFG